MPPCTESTRDPLLWPTLNTDSKRDWQNLLIERRKLENKRLKVTFPLGWETSESLSPRVTRGQSWWADWLIFTVAGQCFNIHLKLGPNKCAKPRREDRSAFTKFLYYHVILKTGSGLVCYHIKKSLHQRRQKEMPVPIQGFQLSYCYCNYEWELLSLWVSCIKSIRITKRTPFTSRLNILAVGFFLFFLFLFSPFDFNITSSLLRCDV